MIDAVVMHITAYVAAVTTGGFLVGLLLGLGLGFLAGPTVRSWLTLREWAEASRQARLADQVLARMEAEPGPRPGNEPASSARSAG